MIVSESQRIVSPNKQTDLFKWLSIGALLFGILVRLVQYLSNRSLWGDEVNVALNIVNRSYLELLQPLDYNQAAPPGFLWIEKLAVQLFGNNEYALRLFPFTSGIVALAAFYLFARRYTSAIAAPIAIALFASLKYLVYYTTEVKQYSSDVMVALLLCLLLIPLRHQVLQPKQILLLGVVGAVFIWISHPTVFVLAGIEVGYWLFAANKQRLTILVNRLPMYLAWLVSFGGLYFLTIRGTLNNDTLTSAWDARFPDSPFDIVWLVDTLGRFFYNPLGFLGFTDGIAIFAFVIGCIAYYRRSRIIFFAIVAPILTTIFASYLQQYPFRERLVLFLTPFFILIIAEGITFLLTRFHRRYRFLWIVGLLISTALIALPLLRAGQIMVHPTQVEEIRPVLAYIKSHQNPGDNLYIYASGRNQFTYYAPKFGYAPNDYVIGDRFMTAGRGKKRKVVKANLKQFQQEVKQFQGKRVWLLFSHTLPEEENQIPSVFAALGQSLDTFKQPGAAVYLYHFKPD